MRTMTLTVSVKLTRDGRKVLWIPSCGVATGLCEHHRDSVLDHARDETWLVDHDTGRYFGLGPPDGRDLVNLWNDEVVR